MKKKFKWTIMGALGVLCASCMTLSITGVASADDTAPVLDTFRMAGASVRTTNPTGIRFETGISVEEKTALKDATFGTLITTEANLAGAELNEKFEGKVVDIKTNVWCSNPTLTTPETAYAGYYGTLVGGTGTGVEGSYENFSSEHYTTVFVARGYVTVDGTTYYTPSALERTIAGVAQYHEDNGEGSEYTADIVKASAKATLTYDYNGGEGSVSSKEMVIGGILDYTAMPEEPTKEGYTFEGWFYEDGTQAFLTSGKILKEDTVVYAKWKTTKERMTFDGSVLSIMTNNGNTYKKVDDNYVFTKYSENVTSGELKLDTTRMEGLFTTGNWIVIKLNASVETWLSVDVGGHWNYLGYTAKFEPVSGEKTVLGNGYAVYEIGKNGVSGETFYSSANGSAETPVVFTIESVTVCTPDEFKLLEAEIKAEANATKRIFDGSVLSLMTDNGDIYEKVGDNYVFTKYSKRVTSGELKLNSLKIGALFAEGNWIVIKLNSSVASWLAVDSVCRYNYLGYTAKFEPVSGGKTVEGNGYAIYKIGSNGIVGDVFFSWSECIEKPVVFTIESVTVCTPDEFKLLEAEIKEEASATKRVFDGSVLSLVTDNGDTYEKVEDSYVFTKYSKKVDSGELKLNSLKIGALFAEGNWIVIKLNSSEGTWFTMDTAGNHNYLGYDTEFEAVSDQKTVKGDGYAIYQIGKGGYSGEIFYSTAQGAEGTPVVFTIESVTVCTTEELINLGFSTEGLGDLGFNV